MSGRGFSFEAGLYSGFFTVRFVLAGPTDSDESTALLFPGTNFLGSSDVPLSDFEPDFLCLLPPEFKSTVSASFFLFGVALLLAGEDDVGVETDVVVGLGLGASVFCIVARVLLAGAGLFLGLFLWAYL